MKTSLDCCRFFDEIICRSDCVVKTVQSALFTDKNDLHKPIYSYTRGRSVACLAPWHAYVGGRAEEDQPRGVGLLWKPNWHELDTEGLLAWCGNIHVMLQPNWGIARLECR